jgi:hypothetical protein
MTRCASPLASSSMQPNSIGVTARESSNIGTGPLVKALGGADISWLAGWFTAAVAYLLLVSVSAWTARGDRRAPSLGR